METRTKGSKGVRLDGPHASALLCLLTRLDMASTPILWAGWALFAGLLRPGSGIRTPGSHPQLTV